MKYTFTYTRGEYRVHKAGCRDIKNDAGSHFDLEAETVEAAINLNKQEDFESAGGEGNLNDANENDEGYSFAQVYYEVLPCAKQKGGE